MNLNVYIASLFEAALNGFLRMDPQAAESLNAISGKVILLTVRGPGLNFYIFPHQNRVEVQSHYTGNANTIITGSPAAFIQYGFSSITGKNPASELDIQGDIETGLAFQKVLAQVEFDWEEVLAQSLGDIPAHQIGNIFRGLNGWFDQATTSTRLDLSEYLNEESGLLLSRTELDYFLDDSDTLRNDIDRLEARLKRLESRLGKPESMEDHK